MAKRARPSFGGALKDSNHPVARSHERHQVGDCGSLLRIAALANIAPSDVCRRMEHGANLGRLGRRAAIKGVLERRAGARTRPVGTQKGGAHCHARIVWRRRYPEMQACAPAQLAFVVAFIEPLKQSHVAERVERDTSRQDQSMAAGPTDEMIDNVKECILEYHLCSRRLIESLLCVLPAVLDTQDSIRIPHLFERNGLAENANEFRRIGRAQEAARPVGECSVEMEIAVRLQGKDLTERSVESIGPAITIAVGGC